MATSRRYVRSGTHTGSRHVVLEMIKHVCVAAWCSTLDVRGAWLLYVYTRRRVRGSHTQQRADAHVCLSISGVQQQSNHQEQNRQRPPPERKPDRSVVQQKRGIKSTIRAERDAHWKWTRCPVREQSRDHTNCLVKRCQRYAYLLVDICDEFHQVLGSPARPDLRSRRLGVV